MPSCNPHLLKQSLNDKLSEAQEDVLAQHLEKCDACRAELDSFAGIDNSWQKIEGVLRNETTGAHSLKSPRTTLVPNRPSMVERLHSIGVEIETSDFAIDFLKPSDNKDALGLLNDIEIRSIIGHGGNGIVLKGFQQELNRLVAVKVMAPQLATSAAARKRFAREAQATAAIVHPNVMPILTVHSDSQLPYLVMPYIDCESLQERIDREGCLPLLDTLRIGHQVAKGLAAAHAQGLVHRDVKPANILLEKGVDRVMLTDFGLARAVDDGTLTRPGIIAGTPQYMSPEQAQGNPVDTRSDLFSLGSVLYAMCTGRAPFRAETTYGILKRVIDEQPLSIASLNPDFPVWLTGYVRQLMAKSVEHRAESTEHIATSLERCVAHVQQPQANDLPEAVQKFAAKSSVQFRSIILSVAAAMTTAVCVWIATNPGSSQKETQPDQRIASAADIEASDTEPKPPPSTAGFPNEEIETANDVEWASALDQDLQLLDAEADALLNSLDDETF